MTLWENGCLNEIFFFPRFWIMRLCQRTQYVQTVIKQMAVYGVKTVLHIDFSVNNAASKYTRLSPSIFLRGGPKVSFVKHHSTQKVFCFILGMEVILVPNSHCPRWKIF